MECKILHELLCALGCSSMPGKVLQRRWKTGAELQDLAGFGVEPRATTTKATKEKNYAAMRRTSRVTLSGPPRSRAIFTSARQESAGVLDLTTDAMSCSPTRLQSPSVQSSNVSPSSSGKGCSGLSG